MKQIKDYEKACEAIAAKFVEKYFKDSYPDSFWVSNDIGGIFFVNDFYFGIDRMVTALKYKATFEQIFDYYNMEIEVASNKSRFGKRNLFNFENYLKYPNNFIIFEEDGKLDFKLNFKSQSNN